MTIPDKSDKSDKVEKCPKCGADVEIAPDESESEWHCVSCGLTELEWLRMERDAMRLVLAGLKKTHLWLEQVKSEPDRDESAVEGAFHDYRQTLDVAMELASHEWTETYLGRVMAFNQRQMEQRAEIERLSRAKPILDERDRQDEKWGPQDHDLPTWLAILMEEVGELAAAALCHRFGNDDHRELDWRKEAIQVAAVALSMIEQARKDVKS